PERLYDDQQRHAGTTDRYWNGDDLSRGSHSSNGQLSQRVAVDHRTAARGRRVYRTCTLQLAKIVRERVPETLSARIAQIVDSEGLERQAADHAPGVGTVDTVGVTVIILVRAGQRARLKIYRWICSGRFG